MARIKDITNKFEREALTRIRKNYPKMTLGALRFIVKRYIHYASLAAIHGFIITVERTFKFSLKSRLWENGYPIEEFSLSTKIFGTEFYFHAESKFLDKYEYQFVQGEEMKKMINDYLETDLVYDITT